MNSRSVKRTLSIFCLVGILILSAFIYFYDLGKESLTTDEYFSLHLARQPLSEIILNHQGQTNPNTIPPLYDIIMHFWLQVFGTSEVAQRSFSALLGVLSVYLLYGFARLLFNTRTGLLSALFGALSYSWFYFFRMNRCYGLFIFLTLLSLYVFFYYIKNKKYQFPIFILTLINVALIYTHYFSFLVIAVEVLISILEWKRNRSLLKSIFFMCFWIALAFAPYCSALWYDLGKEPILAHKLPYASVKAQFIRLIFALFSSFHLRWNPALSVFYAPLIVLGCVKLAKEKSDYFQNRLLYLSVILVIPFLFIYFVTHSDRMRYYAPFSFPLLIVLALGIQKLIAPRPTKLPSGVSSGDSRNESGRYLMRSYIIKNFIIFPLIVISIASFNFIDFFDFFNNPLYENWKGAAQYIKAIPDYQNREMVFIFQTRYNPSVFSYYYSNPDIASALVDNIANYEGYEKDLLKFNVQHKIYWMGDTTGIGEFFEMLDLFPDDSWIWVLRYHDTFFTHDFKKNNNGRYFLHQIMLNQELPQIDFYLIKRVRERD